MFKVLVCDDNEERAKDWCHEITEALGSAASSSSIEVTHLSPADLATALTGLTARQTDARNLQNFARNEVLELIDAVDLLVIDHDLTPETPSDRTAALLGRSGEGFAILARRFSSVGFIVLVNKGVQVTSFDLTMMRFADSFADLNVTDSDISRSALWSGICGPGSNFAPNHWPLLSEIARGDARPPLDFDLNARVIDHLGLGPYLEDFTREQLDGLGDDAENTTFEQIVQYPGLGLGLKDRLADTDQAKRVAAWGVRRWLNTTVLPAQNVLVDFGHAIERLRPLAALLGKRQAIPPAHYSVAESQVTGHQWEALYRHLSGASVWAGRPVWAWSALLGAERELTVSLDRDTSMLVYCEDSRRFVPIAEAHEYDSATPGPYSQRFVERLDSVAYTPRNRLLR